MCMLVLQSFGFFDIYLSFLLTKAIKSSNFYFIHPDFFQPS
jgi:hypothetical protein